MLRSLAAVLVLANVGYLAWTHGWLYRAGMLPSPFPHTEPARIDQQLRAEHIELIREPKPAPLPADKQGGAADHVPEPSTVSTAIDAEGS